MEREKHDGRRILTNRVTLEHAPLAALANYYYRLRHKPSVHWCPLSTRKDLSQHTGGIWVDGQSTESKRDPCALFHSDKRRFVGG